MSSWNIFDKYIYSLLCSGGIQVYGHKENVHVLFNYVLIIVKIKIKVNKRVLMNAEVCSVEWKFINMSQQEEDLILRMYRLVGDRYILSSFLSFPRSCIMAFLIICNDFTTQHMWHTTIRFYSQVIQRYLSDKFSYQNYRLASLSFQLP